jgi:hypothetical protein
MKHLIILILLFSCVKDIKEYCWTCHNTTVITFSREEPQIHRAVSEYCNRTEEWALQSEKDGTWKKYFNNN